MDGIVIVNLSIYCRDQAEAVKATETLSRAGLGLAMDGLQATVNMTMAMEDEDSETIDETEK